MTESWRALQARYKAILARSVDPTLKSAGFKKMGNHYRKWVGSEMCLIVYVSRPKVRIEGKTRFTFDCRLFLAAQWEIFPEFPWIRDRPEGGILQTRIGYLGPEKSDLWWNLKPDDPDGHDDRTASDLRRRFEEYALPWFQQFRNPKDVGDYLSGPEEAPGLFRYPRREIVQDTGNLRNAAIAYYAVGEFGAARRMLELAERSANNKYAAALNTDLRDRLEKLIAEKSGIGDTSNA